VLGFLGFLFIARALGPAAYGGFSFALTIGSLLIFIPHMGADPFYSREVPAGRSTPAETLGRVLSLKAAGSVVFLVLYFGILVIVPTSQAARDAGIFLALAFVLLSVSQSWQTVMITGRRGGLAGGVDAVQAAFFFGLAVAVALLAPSAASAAQAFLGSRVIGLVVGGVLAWRLARGVTWPRDYTWVRPVLASTVPLMLIWFVADLHFHVDTALLYVLRGDEPTGYYAAGYKLVEGMYAGAVVVSSTALPRMSRAWATSREEWRREWRAARRLVTALLAIPAAAFFVAPGLVIAALYGPEFAEAAHALRWLGPGGLALCLTIVYGTALTAAGRERAQLGVTLGALAVNVGLNLWLIPAYAGVGAALATLASAIFYLVVVHGLLQRTFDDAGSVATGNAPPGSMPDGLGRTAGRGSPPPGGVQ
jgi:polysaccharide transporter, PST family